MAAFLGAWLPRALPTGCSFKIKVFRGKRHLLKRLASYLAGLSMSLSQAQRVVILVDCDEDDCTMLKKRLEDACKSAKLLSRTSAGTARWQVATRIVIKELEAWYFGDWIAVTKAFPRVPRSIPQKSAFREPDAIKGKTWTRFAEILTRHGHGLENLSKADIASKIGAHVDSARSTSPSFKRLALVIEEACGQGR